MRTALSCSLFMLLLLMACGPAPKPAQPAAPPPRRTTVQLLDTAAAYRAVITAYIGAMGKRDGPVPDTLYIGRHDEFPDIKLPALIGRTHIRIVTPDAVETVKNGERFTYLNIFGWFNPGEVEFLVINFKQGMRHWPDGRDDRHLRFALGGEQQVLVLDSLW